MTEDETRSTQLFWAEFWRPVILVGFLSGLVIGIVIGRIVQMHT